MSGGIKVFSQLEINGQPTSPKHVITKEYFDEHQLGIAQDETSNSVIILDEQGNETPQRKYVTFPEATVTDDESKDTTIVNINIPEYEQDKLIFVDEENKETLQHKYLKFVGTTITEDTTNDIVTITINIPEYEQEKITFLDDENNESVQRKYIKFVDAIVKDEPDNNTITVTVNKPEIPEYEQIIIMDEDNVEFPQAKYLRFYNSTITKENNVVTVEVHPQEREGALLKIFDINGNDTALEYSFVHNFETKNILYNIYNQGTGEEAMFSFVRVSDNEAKIILSEPLGTGNDYSIMIYAPDSPAAQGTGKPGGGSTIETATWGIRVDTANTNPDTSVIYTDDCITKPPTTFGERPCLLKGGVVQYYLDPNDFTKKEDGTPADITSGIDGDVMIEIPKMALYLANVGDYLDIKLTNRSDAKNIDSKFTYYGHTRETEGDCDKLYVGAYLGVEVAGQLRSLSGATPLHTKTIGACRTLAQANGQGYDLVSFYPLTLLQTMYCVKYRNLDSQTALGRGFVDGNSAALKTGGTEQKGMYWGETTGKQHMKFAGIEDFWGNMYWWIDGLWSDANFNINTAFQNFNDTGAGYTNRGKGASATVNSYCKKVQGTSEMGFIAKETGGSATTYWCDYNYLYASRLPCFGGYWANASYAGAFWLYLNRAASYAYSYVGARLMYLKKSAN